MLRLSWKNEQILLTFEALASLASHFLLYTTQQAGTAAVRKPCYVTPRYTVYVYLCWWGLPANQANRVREAGTYFMRRHFLLQGIRLAVSANDH
jgi:hypothetical protein